MLDQNGSHFQQRVFDEIKYLKGDNTFILIEGTTLELCNGDLHIAAMLSTLMYWCDRGSDKDGWIWKSYREWSVETGLNRNQVDKATKWLKEREYLETIKRMARGHPTLHYRLNQINVLGAISRICMTKQIDLTKPANGRCQYEQMHLPKRANL